MIDEHPDKGDSTIDKWAAIAVVIIVAMYVAMCVDLFVG